MNGHPTPSMWGFCAGQGISIATGIEIQVTRENGNVVAANRRIPKGQKLMHVPTRTLYTTLSVPDDFASVKQRKNVSVHALLAACLTFGPLDDELLEYAPWMCVWPQLSDFTTSMPMFWPDSCLKRVSLQDKATITIESAPPSPADSFALLPPPLTGSWLLQSQTDQSTLKGSTSLILQQSKKLKSHLKSIAKLLPEHGPSLHDLHTLVYWRFVHNWCCVNTRCFYYIVPGQKKPSDPNEAMAMCAGMDMFNHTDGPGCRTTYDRSGYSIFANRDYKAGEEMLLSYGAHNNDVLWAEYGFMLDENQHDAIRIDKLVLNDLNDKQKDLLAEYGFLGGFWLQKDGVCYTTEVAARVTVLSEKEWIRMAQEGLNPTERGDTAPQVKRKAGGTQVAVRRDTARRKVKSRQVEWVLKAKVEAEASIRGLNAMSAQMVLDNFSDDTETLKAQGMVEAEIETTRSKQASQRQAMCLKRWRQIWEMCMSAIRAVEEECPGSFVTGDSGRTNKDLDAIIEEIIA